MCDMRGVDLSVKAKKRQVFYSFSIELVLKQFVLQLELSKLAPATLSQLKRDDKTRVTNQCAVL